MVQSSVTPNQALQRTREDSWAGAGYSVEDDHLRKLGADLCLDAPGLQGCVFDWDDVSTFFTMCSEALSAKTAASEVTKEPLADWRWR